VTAPAARTRRRLRPPSGFEGHLSRREAAAALGLASEFKVRELERQGRLRAVRGVMGSAWYPRADVLALRSSVEETPALAAPGVPRGRRPWTDSEVMAFLRQGSRNVVDLIVEGGLGVTRAQRLYRFWQTHDRPPVEPAVGRAVAPASPVSPAERRSSDRLARGALIARLRDPDPKVRAAAFAALKRR
jgi:hypothetical protein